MSSIKKRTIAPKIAIPLIFLPLNSKEKINGTENKRLTIHVGPSMSKSLIFGTRKIDQQNLYSTGIIAIQSTITAIAIYEKSALTFDIAHKADTIAKNIILLRKNPFFDKTFSNY